MTEDIEKPNYLRLSVQRAMLGSITANLAGLRATASDGVVRMESYFFEMPSEYDRECSSKIASEVIADYPWGTNLEESFDLLSDAPRIGAAWIFLRAEAFDRTHTNLDPIPQKAR